ncbi:hypothetical protein ACS77_22620 [Pseudomonas syringae]|uniref:DUF3050 domain-containing protein n=1 Tax=Pseudomonas syringae TaxID=317 RepID=A0A0L1M0G6_PSESX|nr:hypothetical protein ACS77_22620 [Pseudomonas syringae]
MFEKELEPYRSSLADHQLYSAIRTVDHAGIFMSRHVFAVWDFMSLAKRLQNDFTCTRVPWMPVKDEHSARLINEIITGEESDIDGDGQPTSHYRLYLEAMKEVKAPTGKIEKFISEYRATSSLGKALKSAHIPMYVEKFVKNTLKTARKGTTAEVASSFLFGREDPIPNMFQALLGAWGLTEERVPKLVYYLNRHIEVDSGDHGPGAQKMLATLITTPHMRQLALNAAINAIEHRIELWDGILHDIRSFDAPSQKSS